MRYRDVILLRQLIFRGVVHPKIVTGVVPLHVKQTPNCQGMWGWSLIVSRL